MARRTSCASTTYLLLGSTFLNWMQAKYLVSVSSSLTREERDRLTKTAWLTKEDAHLPKSSTGDTQSRPERYKAKDLYEPTDALRGLDLPVLAWTTSKWRSTSEEAKLLFSLGLKRHPDVDEILGLAASANHPVQQRKALAYFLVNFENVYNQLYQSNKHGYAFVPVLREGQKAFVKPTEAYSSTGSAVLGFPMLHPDFQLHAAKFKLANDPRSSDLIARLVNSPPADTASAVPIFAYLAGQASRKCHVNICCISF